MDAPVCRICGKAHWSYEKHRFAGEEKAPELPKGVTKGPSSDHKTVKVVTTKPPDDHKIEGMTTKVGRPRKYGDSKERYRVYNRKRRGV